MTTKFPAVHPGEVLLEEFLEPVGLSQYRLTKNISVPPGRINEIVHGKRAVTADTALRLARSFGTTPRLIGVRTLHTPAVMDPGVSEVSAPTGSER